VALQRAQMRMGRWTCGIKLHDRVSSKVLRKTLGLDDIVLVLQQNSLQMVWACAAKRRQWLGEEKYKVWSEACKTKRL